MMTGSSTCSGEKRAIVCVPMPGIANATVSRPGTALASAIACRRLPGPESKVFVTVKTAPRAVWPSANANAMTSAEVAANA